VGEAGVGAAVDDAHVEDRQDRGGGEEAELGGGEIRASDSIVVADGGEADGDRGGEAEGLRRFRP